MALGLGGGSFGLGFAMGGSSASTSDPSGGDAHDEAFAAAVETCDPDTDHIEVLDGGESLSLQSEGEESSGAPLTDIYCVLQELEMPDATLSRMDGTRALDGTREGTWNGIRASWTFHPDSGLDIVLDRDRR